MLTRREIGKFSLAGVPAATVLGTSPLLRALAQTRPNSLIEGVQIGTITYSYRSMPEQTAEATLRYIIESGIRAVELMGGPVNDWARKKGNFQPSTAGRAGGGGGGGRAGGGGGGGRGRGDVDPATLTAEWNGVKCAPGREGDAPRGGGAGAAPPLGAPTAGGGGGRGRGDQTPEQQAAAAAAAEVERKWRMGLSMDIFKDLRKMYNDAGVTIYAVKDVRQDTD